MNFLNKFFHTNKASPKNTLSSTMSFLFGSSTAGQNVTERTTMQNTAVYAFVRVLPEGLAEPHFIFTNTPAMVANSRKLSTRFIFCTMMHPIQK